MNDEQDTFGSDSEPPPVLSLPCYEPGGLVLQWDAWDLLKGILISGSIGSGKTSLINSLLREMIRYRAEDPARRIGLLILDPKADATADNIRTLAAQAGREADVIVLPGDRVYFPIFEKLLTGLNDVPELSRLLEMSALSMGSQNAWWEQIRGLLLSAALELYLISGDQPTYFALAEYLSSFFLRPQDSQPMIKSRLAIAEDLLRHFTGLSRTTQTRLRLALDQVRYWLNMDPRTQSNIQVTFVTVLSPLVSAVAEQYFAPNRIMFDPAQAVADGKILIASCNAAVEPAQARFLFRVLKRCFYRSVQLRPEVDPETDRLVGLIADEWPLCATPDDVAHMQTVRARGAFHLCSLQGLVSLDEAIGRQTREALLINLNTFFFLKSHEPELDDLANRIMGIRDVSLMPKRSSNPDEAWPPELPPIPRAQVPVCVPGSLSKLKPHQAYVSLPGEVLYEPVWPVPTIMRKDYPGKRQPIAATPGAPGTARLGPGLGWLSSHHTLRLLQALERTRMLTLAQFDAAVKICELRAPENAREELRRFLSLQTPMVPSEESLSSLPLSWCPAILNILRQSITPDGSGQLGHAITQLGCHEGYLVLQLAQETADDYRAWDATKHHASDRLRVQLQRAVYPSIYRALKKRDALRLKIAFPECCTISQP